MQDFAADAKILLNEALKFMAAKAGVTEAEILSAIEADPRGNATRYLCDLLAVGIPAIANR